MDERRLEEILNDVAAPLVRHIVASIVRDSRALEDAEDIVADTLVDLLRRFRDANGDTTQPIHDLRRYIVTCAYNRCHERMRERYPARTRLRNQLRYLCGHDPELALWRDARNQLVCGIRAWQGGDATAWVGDHRLGARSDPAAENRAQVAMLLRALLHHAGAPVTLEALTGAIARLIGVEQQSVETTLSDLEPSPLPGPEEALETRVSLRELWTDVRRLTAKQRAALLLNLRDAHGRECLSLLALTNTATIPEIARAVEIPLEQFVALWNDLPLSDNAIAALLEVTPRQVIKFRRLARERLRRLAKSRDDQNVGPKIDSILSRR